MKKQYDSMAKQYNAEELAEYVDAHYTQRLRIPNIYTAYTSFMHRSRNDSRNFLNIFIEASKNIEKYARAEKYTFMGVEYDYTLYINRSMDPKTYDKCLKANSNQFKCKVEIKKPLEGIVNTNLYLAIGDKNWLTAEHSIRIEIPVPYRDYYSEREVIGVTELLNKYIVIRT